MLLLSAPDLDATAAIAARLAQLARPGDVIVLAGEMGAGKTAFARAFGAAIGVIEPITSPTFTLVHSYEIDGRRSLHHADLYRLETTSEIEDLALPELAEFGGIVLVEWGDVAGAVLGPVLEVRLEPPDDDAAELDDFGLNSGRIITISSIGGAWAPRWDRLAAAVADFGDGL